MPRGIDDLLSTSSDIAAAFFFVAFDADGLKKLKRSSRQ